MHAHSAHWACAECLAWFGHPETRTKILIADPRLEEMVIEVCAEGPCKEDGSPGLRITTLRENPSVRGAVTGTATLNSFFSSLSRLCQKAPLGDGVHLC